MLTGINQLLEEMIDFQQRKVFKVACELHPHLAPDDLLNPQDFPVLLKDPTFNYEDGILTGYLAVRTALQSYFNESSQSEHSSTE